MTADRNRACRACPAERIETFFATNQLRKVETAERIARPSGIYRFHLKGGATGLDPLGVKQDAPPLAES